MKKTIEQIKSRVDEKIQLALDINNGDNELQQSLGWGMYIVYRYNHFEHECEEFVTFEDEEEARTYLENQVEEFCTLDDVEEWDKKMKEWEDAGTMTEKESRSEMTERFSEFDEVSSWDLPIRKGRNRTYGITVGFAFVDDFIQCLDEQIAKYFLETIIGYSLVPGFIED